MAAGSMSAMAQPGRHGAAGAASAAASAHADMAAKRLAKLHDVLKLTAAQEPAWTTFAASIAPPAGASHPDRAAIAAMSAPQRMEQAIAMAKQHVTMMEARLSALNTFYVVLTAEQKKVFDDHVKGGHFAPHRMGMGMRMGMHH